jgi:hypothetical protein
MSERLLMAEGGVLIVLGVAGIITGRLLGAVILIGLGGLAMACAWMLRPIER